MEKEWPSLKCTSDEKNIFCGILADPENNFMETLEKSALKKYPAVKYLISLLLNVRLRKCLAQSKKLKRLES